MKEERVNRQVSTALGGAESKLLLDKMGKVLERKYGQLRAEELKKRSMVGFGMSSM